MVPSTERNSCPKTDSLTGMPAVICQYTMEWQVHMVVCYTLPSRSAEPMFITSQASVLMLRWREDGCWQGWRACWALVCHILLIRFNPSKVVQSSTWNLF